MANTKHLCNTIYNCNLENKVTTGKKPKSRSVCETFYSSRNKMSFLQLAAGLTGQPSMPNNMPSAGVNPPATATERASRSVFGTDDLNDILLCFKMPALYVIVN